MYRFLCQAPGVRFELPRHGEPRRPFGPRDPGDAWVISPAGQRYWGRFGAAGLLALDPNHGVLLQHRAAWSHFGDTWGLPGGARHQGEAAVDGALREAGEEAGVPDGSVRPRFMSVLDLGFWSYATVVGDVVKPFDPAITDAESRELAWVPLAEVDDRPLHPGFADAWPHLRPLLDVRPVVVVDAANVVGSVPDGWWKDRAGATERMLGKLARLVRGGLPSQALGLTADVWFPEWMVVVEGQARRAAADGEVTLVRAEASGDDTIAAEAHRLVSEGCLVTVVTSDRGLADRVAGAGATVVGTRWLIDRFSA
jgi:8-oxo-dGTP diphosphatase